MPLAIRGGYHLAGSGGGETIYSGANSDFSAWTHPETQSSCLVLVQETFRDAVFWQAFGRALGWDTPCDLVITCEHGDAECRRCHDSYWMYQWHGFMQHLANGQPPDAFFARLHTLEGS